MSNEHKPLTLERWAALDQAASPGPWVHLPETDGGEAQVLGPLAWPDAADPAERIHVAQVGGAFDSYTNPNAELMAASRQAPTRLLAALRGLAREWDEKESQHVSSDYGKACAYEACAAQLRHLIATNDLAATATCQHDFQANYGLYDTSHRYCTKCGVAE